jgi:ribonuclease E
MHAMTKRMLVDAAYPEETRVVVADEQQLLDFDFETASKRQLKGNIYLAKVIRVEPSLQAAFVDYGGNRHGFLAFSEIHPDYYQIPQADRDRLAELETQLAQSRGDEEPADDEGGGAATGSGEDDADAPPPAETVNADGDAEQAEFTSQLRRERAKLLRSYKIQEVIRRRQIMLVQVVKEERGTKGAALTTYLSLAGRYCVLMPNTPKGGGISRKISTNADRSRLKKIAQDLQVPTGMGLIIRTAGQERTKAEIRRDYEYLLRLWNDIRERTLESVAPCPIYEEADLIRRAMRDLYTNDIEEVLVEGEHGYRTAKSFMTMLMPSRARRVKQYKGETPLFFAHKVEDQLDKMHDATVQLRSGGSIVIHTTEALTAIDVNSGRATRERHIDETAVKTNLEAADEVARQLRLRDIAGLVVIDFIDMAEHRHQRQVEKRLRDALKIDRARLQVGRISTFGLLELSRQRLRPSFLELSTQPCPVCHGTGFCRSTESAALQALRRVEALGVEGKAAKVAVVLPVEVALYMLNQKRVDVQRIEHRYGLDLHVKVDDRMVASEFRVDVLEAAVEPAQVEAPPEVEKAAAEKAPGEKAAGEESEKAADDGGKRKRRRRRRPKRKGEGEIAATGAGEAEGEDVAEAPTEAPTEAEAPAEAAAASEAEAPASAEAAEQPAAAEGEEAPAKPKRRRRRRKPAGETEEVAAEASRPGEETPPPAAPAPTPPAPAEIAEELPAAAAPGDAGPVPAEAGADDAAVAAAAPAAEAPTAEQPSAPEVVDAVAPPTEPELAAEAAPVEPTGNGGAPSEPEAAEAVEAAGEPMPATGEEAAGADTDEAEAGNGHGHSPGSERTPIEDRPDVVVDDAAVTEAPRRTGWWSRWTRSPSQG